jgi:hypothetical protein
MFQFQNPIPRLVQTRHNPAPSRLLSHLHSESLLKLPNMATQESLEDLNQLWESALAEYAKDTTGKDKDAINLDALLSPGKSLTSPDELLAQIEASGQSFEDFRSKRGKLWDTLKLFVSPLAAVLKIAITPSSVGEFGIPVSAVLGACLHLVLVRRICFLSLWGNGIGTIHW